MRRDVNDLEAIKTSLGCPIWPHLILGEWANDEYIINDSSDKCEVNGLTKQNEQCLK